MCVEYSVWFCLHYLVWCWAIQRPQYDHSSSTVSLGLYGWYMSLSRKMENKIYFRNRVSWLHIPSCHEHTFIFKEATFQTSIEDRVTQPTAYLTGLGSKECQY